MWVKSLAVRNVVSVVSGILFLISVVALLASHLDARPAQSIMTLMVWVLPVIYFFRYSYEFSVGQKCLLLFSLILFLSSVAGSLFVDEFWEGNSFRAYWLYLLPLGLVPIIENVPIKKDWFLNILILCALCSFVVVFKDISSGSIRGARHGLPIPYGTISLSTSLLCLIFAFDKSVHPIKKAFLLMSFILASVGVVWSQTRGAWVYLIIWILVVSFVWFKYEKPIQKKSIVTFIALMITGLFVLLPPGKFVQKRISDAVYELEMYAHDSSAKTSSGQRLDLWFVSFEAFCENPVFGGGTVGFLEKRNELMESGHINIYSTLQHSHNDLLWFAATRGAVGVLALLLVYIGLFLYYLRCLKHPVTSIYGAAGLTIVGGAIVYGITDIYMSVKITIGYFFVINSLIIGLIEKDKLENDKRYKLCEVT